MPSQIWILVADRLPDVDQSVWYFFEVTGVSAGRYHGTEETGLPTFGGRGFLAGDVTHWMPRVEGDPEPGVPAGYTYPERCLARAATLPFDEPEVCHQGNREDHPIRALDWAHAAARGVFECLYDQHDVRWRLRSLPDEARPPLVAVMTEGLRRAAREQRDWPQAVSEALTRLVAQPVAKDLLIDWEKADRIKAEKAMVELVQLANAHAAAYALSGVVVFG